MGSGPKEGLLPFFFFFGQQRLLAEGRGLNFDTLATFAVTCRFAFGLFASYAPFHALPQCSRSPRWLCGRHGSWLQREKRREAIVLSGKDGSDG